MMRKIFVGILAMAALLLATANDVTNAKSTNGRSLPVLPEELCLNNYSEDFPCRLSIVSLIARPRIYGGMLIDIHGSLIRTEGGLYLCLNPTDYDHGIDSQCVYLRSKAEKLSFPSDEIWKDVVAGRNVDETTSVRVIGVYSYTANKRDANYFATIDNIERFEIDRPAKKE